MQAHLQGTTSLCTLVKLTERRLDGTLGESISVCNNDFDVAYLGDTYRAIYLEPSQLQSTAGLTPDNAEITTPVSEEFSSADVRGHRWLGARVEINVINYEDVSMGPALRKIGSLGESTVGRFAIKTELRSLAQMLNQTIGDMVTEHCRCSELGEPLCGVHLDGLTAQGDPITAAGIVTAVTDKQQFTVSLNSGTFNPANDFYLKGRALWTSGANEDLRESVLWNTGNQVTLFLPMRRAIQVGDTLSLIAGCDRKRATCRDKFANAKRFRGFPDLPGRDRLFTFPQGATQT
jgi:uncharacterized phage protein (TIGR02218 family)